MKVIEAGKANDLVSKRLGVTFDFSSRLEGLAEYARHIASFECPCTERHLVASLARYLSGTVPQLNPDSAPSATAQAGTLIDGLLDHGDLVEVEDADTGSRSIALRAPAACALSNNRAIVLGIVPFGADSLPAIYRPNRQLKGYGRIIVADDSMSVLNELHSAGYVIISEDEWAHLPSQLNAKLHLNSYVSRFRQDVAVGQIEGLRVLDPVLPVGRYNLRWTSRPAHDGDFVARRQRKYGNEAWSFVRLLDSRPVALVDLPTKNFSFRACDEAWHLQQAIDHERGHPQRYEVVALDSGEVHLRFFSPIPQWAHRRLTSLGEQTNAPDCLLAYCFPSATVAHAEVKFVETRMWLSPL